MWRNALLALGRKPPSLNAVHAGWSASRLRRISLWLMLALLLLCLLKPEARLPHRVYDWFFVLDITQSMNVSDYSHAGRSLSRLQVAKQAIRQSLAALPCGSRVALGLFTERDTVTVVKPLEVCSHYAALEQTVARMDWRMAWAADSFIAHGLYSALEQSQQMGGMQVMFFTDGQQAPPANPAYMPHYAGKASENHGYLLGTGQTAASRIPKLDEHDAVAGYWEQEEVQRFGNFGMAATLSVLAMEQGMHDRNAGHGPGNSLLMHAHLSAMDSHNLQTLAKETGLQMQALADADSASALVTSGPARWQWTVTDMRPLLAALALGLWVLYLALTFADRRLFLLCSLLIRPVKALYRLLLPHRFLVKE